MPDRIYYEELQPSKWSKQMLIDAIEQAKSKGEPTVVINQTYTEFDNDIQVEHWIQALGYDYEVGFAKTVIDLVKETNTSYVTAGQLMEELSKVPKDTKVSIAVGGEGTDNFYIIYDQDKETMELLTT